MFKDDEWKTAIDDARQNHAAVIDLIFFTERKALGLVRLYITLALASAGGAVEGLSTSTLLSTSSGLGLMFASFVFGYGSWKCFRTMRISKISLPGKPAEFWLWAQDSAIEKADFVGTYLQQLHDSNQVNDELNRRMSSDLSAAMNAGLAAPVVAVSIGALAAIAGL